MESSALESDWKTKYDVVSYYNLSSEQEIAFNEFKRRALSKFKEFVDDDFQLYRFLKARKFDVDKAEIMFRNHTAFQQKYKVNTLLKEYEPKEPLKSYWVYNNMGFDKEGSLIILMSPGIMDSIGIAKSVSKEDCTIYNIYSLERFYKRALEHAEELKEPVKGFTWIVDYENFTLAKATQKLGIELLMESASIYESNYPECLKTAYVINAPVYFNLIFNALKLIMPEEWFRKIHVYGKDGWKSELLKLIDPEVLPAYLGGTKTDPDGNPRCITTLTHGDKIPKHYYFRSPERRLINQEGVKKYHIKRMGKVTIIHKIKISGSFIDWEFESEAYDIGFGLFCKTEEKETLKELICVQRANSHMCCQTGTFLCETTGEYIIVLDNSHSWFRSKQIFMKSSVRKP